MQEMVGPSGKVEDQSQLLVAEVHVQIGHCLPQGSIMRLDLAQVLPQRYCGAIAGCHGFSEAVPPFVQRLESAFLRGEMFLTR